MTTIAAPRPRYWRWPAAPTTPRRARRAVSRSLTAWQLERLADEVVLLVSELVANACLHGPAGAPVIVTLRCTGHGVYGEVRDASPVFPRGRSYVQVGRGLWLIVHMASAFWFVPVEGGKVACFILEDVP